MSYEPGLKTATELALAGVQDNKKMEFIQDHKTELKDDDITNFPRPKVSCKKCYGRGISGWYYDTKDPIICSCISDKAGLVNDRKNLLTWFEFRALLETKLVSDPAEHIKPKSLRRKMSKVKKLLKKSRKRYGQVSAKTT